MDRTVSLTVILIGSLLLIGWWVEDRFGSTVSVSIVLGITHLLAFAGGAILSFAITRGSLSAVNNYARQDAMVDRFRLQSFKSLAGGIGARQKADAQLEVIEARRIDKLASERAKLLVDLERQKMASEFSTQAASWSWDDDEEVENRSLGDSWE
jgi:hypothetical protein